MKETLLKDALLPYYNNDEDLYNKRVTIIDNSGERTLRFFTEATKKDNVLAVAFQDEALTHIIYLHSIKHLKICIVPI